MTASVEPGWPIQALVIRDARDDDHGHDGEAHAGQRERSRGSLDDDPDEGGGDGREDGRDRRDHAHPARGEAEIEAAHADRCHEPATQGQARSRPARSGSPRQPSRPRR